MVRGMKASIRIRWLHPNKLIFDVKNSASTLKSASHFRAYEVAHMATLHSRTNQFIEAILRGAPHCFLTPLPPQ